MTKYFVDKQGDYIGGFDGDAALALVPVDAVEIPAAPDDARQKWDNKTKNFLPYTPEKIVSEVEVLKEVLFSKGAITKAEIAAKETALKGE